tara:strand:+ start:989 stop:1876 length:888 start_codon:yes stop_codon:yes gene_type:complete
MKKNILVIGGSGFLGSHVADSLSETGFKVTIYDNNKSNWLKNDQKFILGDVLDEKKLDNAIKKNKIIFNFAGISDLEDAYLNPKDVTKYNVLANNLILESCKKNKIDKYIFASSVYVYGKFGGFYKTSKQCCELFIKNYHDTYNLNYLILQFGTLYGDRSNSKNGIYNYLRQAIKNKKIEYNGSKESVRNYINVKDAAKVCVDLLEKKMLNKTYIITGNDERKITDTFQLIQEIIGKKINVVYKKPKNKNHYEITPYSIDYDTPIKYSINKSIDFGFGIHRLLNQIRKNEKDNNF